MSVGESFAVASVGSTQLSAALGPLLIGGLLSAMCVFPLHIPCSLANESKTSY